MRVLGIAVLFWVSLASGQVDPNVALARRYRQAQPPSGHFHGRQRFNNRLRYQDNRRASMRPSDSADLLESLDVALRGEPRQADFGPL